MGPTTHKRSRTGGDTRLKRALVQPFHHRPAVMLFALTVTVACAEAHPLASTSGLVGRWGGVDAELSATSNSVRLDLVCGPIEFLAPLKPARDGGFTIEALGRGGTTRRPRPPTLLRGRVAGVAMEVQLSYLLPDSARSLAFKLVRDQPPSWRSVCLP